MFSKITNCMQRQLLQMTIVGWLYGYVESMFYGINLGMWRLDHDAMTKEKPRKDLLWLQKQGVNFEDILTTNF